MIYFDNFARENTNECNPNSPKIPNYSYSKLILGKSGSNKTNVLLNSINHQSIWHQWNILISKSSIS